LIYDAIIAAAAMHADCDTFWLEDKHDGVRSQDQLWIAKLFCAC